VGAVCCRVEEEHKVYIMTLGVLAPYRQLKIGMFVQHSHADSHNKQMTILREGPVLFIHS
jgi:hypothetical protein